MANAAAAPAAATSEESLWVSAATPVLVAAAEADEALVPVTVVAPEVSVLDLFPVSVELGLSLVEVPELEPDLLEQTTSVGRSVTPPRAQIDLATLIVADEE